MEWPTDVLVQLLHTLASDAAAQRAWHQLAFMTCKRDALARAARIMPRPILLRIEIEPSEDTNARIFKIPFYQATVVCVDVDWGDGCVDKLREKGDGYVEHAYAAPGEYTVCVFPANGREEPSGRFLDHLGFLTEIYSWRSTAAWWRPLRQIISLGRVGLQSLSYLFAYCDVFNVDLNHLSVGDITDMSGMFYLSKFNQPIGDWNVSNVANMRHMFACAPAFNQPIGKWDVSKVTDMSYMFWDAGDFDQPIGDWDVSNVTNLSHMFHCASNFNQPIGKWNVHKVTDFAGLFSCAVAFNQPIGEWDVRNATNMNDTFRSTRSFNQSIGKWNVSNVTSMRYMFDGAPVFNQDISGWKVSKVTDMTGMFFGAFAFNQPIGKWDVSNATNKKKMLGLAGNFNQPLSQWNVSEEEMSKILDGSFRLEDDADA